MEYSTDKGSTWHELGDFTVTRGILQHIIMDVYLSGSSRFRISQTSGMRVNIDDITIYAPTKGMKGDVNNDGEINIADINALLDIIMGGYADEATKYRADVNDDDEIGIADVNVIIAIILAS